MAAPTPNPLKALRQWLDRAARLGALPEGMLRDRIEGRFRRPLADIAAKLPMRSRSRQMSGAILAIGPGLRTGHAEAGEAILAEGIALGGRHLMLNDALWRDAYLPTPTRVALEGFVWLADLTAAGEAGALSARALIGSWLDRGRRDAGLPNPTAVRAERLQNWLLQAERFLPRADPTFRTRFLGALLDDAAWLARALPAELSGSALIGAAKALSLAGLALPEGEAWLARGYGLLERELGRQILSDGGHVERCPSRQLALIADLCDLRYGYQRRGLPIPGPIEVAIAALAPVTRLLQHGDGGLALFNGGNEERAGYIERVLAAAGDPLVPLGQAPQSGFQRLVAGKLVAIVDSGRPPAPGYDAIAHAGTFSLEVSIGRDRMIVNGGSHPEESAWQDAMRATAAHSTLVLADTNSSGLLPGGIGHRPAVISCKREEGDAGVWLDMLHDGYRRGFGIRHRRRLYLAANGEDLRGEDALEGPGEPVFHLRFHLHPEVTVSLAQSGQAAILRTPSGSGWRLRVEGGTMSLADSVYLGDRGRIRRTQQVIVEARHGGGESRLRWALARDVKRRERPARPAAEALPAEPDRTLDEPAVTPGA